MPNPITPSVIPQVSNASQSSEPPPSNDGGSPANFNDDLDRGLREAFAKDGVKVDLPDDPVDEQTEKKTDPEQQRKPAEQKPPEQKKPTQEDAPVKKPGDDEAPIDPESIQPPKNISPKMAEGWNALKKNSTRAWNALSRATEENKRLQKALAERATTTNSEFESLKKENEELRSMRAVVDFEHDPEFIEKFEKPANGVREQMVSMLKSLNVKDDVIADIDFSDAGVISRVAAVIQQRANEVTANRFLKRGEEFIDLNEKKDKALQEHRSKYKEFHEQRRKKAETTAIEERARATKRIDDIRALRDEDGSPRVPYITKKEVPADATNDQIAQIERHNKMVDVYGKKLDDLMKMNSPEERAEIAVAAVGAQFIAEHLKSANERIKSLEESLKKYNDLTSERGSIRPGGESVKNESLDLDVALSAAFPGRS